ncbi:MAG: YeeE/YedE family protein [Roseateles sp.]|nr:MAG: YeeE/YedE family protein [Roseateles sp.]
MNIAWQAFTPWAALAGGLLIGLAAALFVLLNGRIAGISGILGGLLQPVRGDVGWRLAFVGGLLVAPWLYALLVTSALATVDAGWGQVLLAGLLVGVGTRLGSGCTSGHGVCGLSRLSLRSLVATLCFMATGFLTVYVIRHMLAA